MSWCEYRVDCWKARAYRSMIRISNRGEDKLLSHNKMNQYKTDCNDEHESCSIRKEKLNLNKKL